MVAPGINGKMSEFNAALGLLQLKLPIDALLASARDRRALSRSGSQGVRGMRCLHAAGETRDNYAYFPILIDDDFLVSRDELNELLKAHNIFGRRYFYPLSPISLCIAACRPPSGRTCRSPRPLLRAFSACRFIPIWRSKRWTRSAT